MREFKLYVSKIIFPILGCFLFYSPLGFTVDAPTCRECCEEKTKETLTRIREAESRFMEYRWLQGKIRMIYFGPLWQARINQNHPTDALIRKQGRDTEENLMKYLQELENRATAAANTLKERLDQIRFVDRFLADCHLDPSFRECCQNAAKAASDTCSELTTEFEHIFESERQYLLEVSRTAGGPQGLYPEDTLEKEMDHGDFWDRFERDRIQGRFESNQHMMTLFTNLERFYKENPSLLDCCKKASMPYTQEKLEGVSVS